MASSNVSCHPWSTGLLLAAAASALVAPAPARAHAIESSLERITGLTRTLELQSRYSTGVPAAGAQVSLVAPDGASVALGTTDAQGQLRFVVPATADAAWEVKVDQGPGHRDYLELPAEVTAGGHARRLPGLRFVQPLAWGGGSLLLLGALVGWTRRRNGES